MCVCVCERERERERMFWMISIGTECFIFAYQFSHADVHHLILTVLLSSYHHLSHHRTISDQIYLYCVCELLKYLL